MNNRFHCCATCQHFRVVKEAGQTSYRCARLTYETRPEYQFRCWSPTEKVKRLMQKRRSQSNLD
ncbi:hypothetical protein LOK74_12505 [Brevibacillus humidisoli]|uniref:hypothetical protein n=1 Tax=Brevibacillus humidisoli TaxID=2895522 RepID=UPI001E3F1FAE|nr:hypothetical protein [Brevibacillus humidisoli]UFJ43306.1 hypothetical protein LOK74_12505 [Brevibacillus humidisoli]